MRWNVSAQSWSPQPNTVKRTPAKASGLSLSSLTQATNLVASSVGVPL
jgi:hypothetical protein